MEKHQEPELSRSKTLIFRLKEWIDFRRGMAGTVVVILVLGYMVSISFSNAYLVQTEIKGTSAKGSNKRAYFAAFAGINYLVSQLRASPTTTYSSDYGNALYFSDVANKAKNHYCTFKSGGAGDVTYTSFLAGHTAQHPVAQKLYFCSTPSISNLGVDPEKFRFYVSGYPGSTTAGIYWVKSQGIYRDDLNDGSTESKCQMWAELDVDRSGEVVILKRFGQMPLQSLTYSAGTVVDDFWDWERF